MELQNQVTWRNGAESAKAASTWMWRLILSKRKYKPSAAISWHKTHIRLRFLFKRERAWKTPGAQDSSQMDLWNTKESTVQRAAARNLAQAVFLFPVVKSWVHLPRPGSDLMSNSENNACTCVLNKWSKWQGKSTKCPLKEWVYLPKKI